MKKLLLTFALIFSTSVLLAQNFNQPTQFNNVCDDNNDGFASFWLGEISFEILGNLNSQDYTITHHVTQLDATTGANALSSPYFNVNPFTQIIFVRIVTIATNQVTILTYNLNVNQAPNAPNLTHTFCDADSNPSDGITAVDLTVISSIILQNQQGDPMNYGVNFYTTLANAQNQAAPITVLNNFIATNQQTIFYVIEDYTSGTGCFGIGSVVVFVAPCSTNCPAPTQLFLSEPINLGSISVDWSPSLGATSYNVLYSVNGGVYQTITSQTSSATIPNVICGSTYTITVNANCGNNGISENAAWITYNTATCPPQAGEAANLTVCGDNASGCFNLTINDFNIIGNLNPENYTITYHLSQANADNDVLAITSPTNFCTQHGTIIYARLENNTTGAYQTFAFALLVETYNSNVIQLNDMSQCDNNADSVVTFNLTTIQSQLNTANTLEYYPSLSNAHNQVVPFTNPSALNIGVQNTTTQVFVRELVANGCDNIYNFQLYAFSNCNISYTCSQANSLCNSLGNPFTNTYDGPTLGTPSINCLGSTPHPTWFYLPISTGGTVNLQITQVTNGGAPIDVDYIIHGPFTDPISPCTDQTQLINNVVSCSYSAAAIEYPVIPNAQQGQFYLIMVTNYSGQAGYITISELPSSTATIDCSGIRLNAFLDSNNNGTQDNGESNFPLGQFTYEINNNGNVHNIVSSNGVYNIYDTSASNSYDLSYTINPSYAGSYNLSTVSYSNVHIVIGAGVTTYNFPVTVTQAYNDLAVSIIPINAPRPGFAYMNKIIYSNNGNQTIASGTVTFNHDSLVAVTANSQTGTTPITNGFTYNFTNLLPFESREMTVTMQVPTIPTVSIGGLLTNTASIVPLNGDLVPLNNNVSSTQVIIGSYDPNDKMEAHGGRILHSTFTPNDYLTYTIRFENSGTASAENVRVNDVLNADLDETTIRMVSASHSYIMDRVGNNVNWIFDNIQLPVSVANTDIGKGYITFQIKPRAGYAVGDIIPNAASIYFDFNPAIVTNTFNTEFVAQLGVGEFENADFVFYPNPVSDIVTIKVKNSGTIANIAVYDVTGKTIVVQKPATASSTEALNLSNVSKGMYLLEVTTDSNAKVLKKLIVE